MLRFQEHEDFVEIRLVSQEPDNLPSRGDAYLSIQVSSAGFTGHNDLWVVAAALHCFCEDLLALERERRGQAMLESISPGELGLRIRSIDSLGHMAAEGFTGHGVQRQLFRPWHAVHFGFEFDPSQLVNAVHVDWIKRNAEQGARPNSHERRV